MSDEHDLEEIIRAHYAEMDKRPRVKSVEEYIRLVHAATKFTREWFVNADHVRREASE